MPILAATRVRRLHCESRCSRLRRTALGPMTVLDHRSAAISPRRLGITMRRNASSAGMTAKPNQRLVCEVEECCTPITQQAIAAAQSGRATVSTHATFAAGRWPSAMWPPSCARVPRKYSSGSSATATLTRIRHRPPRVSTTARLPRQTHGSTRTSGTGPAQPGEVKRSLAACSTRTCSDARYAGDRPATMPHADTRGTSSTTGAIRRGHVRPDRSMRSMTPDSWAVGPSGPASATPLQLDASPVAD